jgi:signal transduction histidine kinase
MRLKTKLVVAATGSTFVIVLVLSALFLGESLKQRIAQTAANNEVMTRQILLMTRQAVEDGLSHNPPADGSDAALHVAVTNALENYDALNDTMNSFVRYNPAVQDVSIADGGGLTLVSTDPQMLDQPTAKRATFDRLRNAHIWIQARELFGAARVLDVSSTLTRNGKPFLVAHVGVQSTFLKNNYAPELKDALIFAVVAGFFCMVAAGVLASLSLRPIEEISRRLETLAESDDEAARSAGRLGRPDAKTDAVVRVTKTIERLDQQMRSTEAGYTGLRQSLNQVLDTLREGVILFTAERRAAMVSDAVSNFMGDGETAAVGKTLDEIFHAPSALGAAVLKAFGHDDAVSGQRIRLEDGREVEITLDRIDDRRGRGQLGTLLTLRDAGSAKKLEQELEVSRRLAAVGRLTAGVGHEVKNPINAMVVHLELLKSKLGAAGDGRSFLGGAMRHVEILAGEMERLDRVVQTLADFTRPMELHLSETDLRDVVERVVELTDGEMAERRVEVRCELQAARVWADPELLRQALLNLMLNGMQAMDHGGVLRVAVRREQDTAVVEVADEGTGIAAELMPKIFDLYFTTKPKGSGIGLAMTYRIVQMHGGAMEVASSTEPGPAQGAVFTMRLPLAVAGTRSERALAGRAA